ncbi:hypothetical protein [Pontiella sp.]|uniref:hypothetical protein n=1 Tax=Pontiella sp. TaxID=2837462 RepID=UPI0035694CE5
MKRQVRIYLGVVIILGLGGAPQTATAKNEFNQWRGEETGADWSDRYKWTEMHAPRDEEAVYFRDESCMVSINSTVNLNNGIHLYGEELTLRGNGNLNLQHPTPHQRTVNVPASATGFANLTLNDNLSLNGRIALSAKGFGTSACKGSVTLKDRATVTGALTIGNDGTGTGLVYVKDSSTYRITGLELNTEADSGGSAEIHVLGGTVRIECETDPFEAFLSDASRKLVVGDCGTVRIDHKLHPSEKKEAIKSMIVKNRLVAAPGCRLLPPVIQDNLMIIRAEDERNDSKIKTEKELLAAIDAIKVLSSSSVAATTDKPQLESLLKTMNAGTAAAVGASPAAATPASGKRMAGYIVFFGTVLLTLRRAPREPQA